MQFVIVTADRGLWWHYTGWSLVPVRAVALAPVARNDNYWYSYNLVWRSVAIIYTIIEYRWHISTINVTKSFRFITTCMARRS